MGRDCARLPGGRRTGARCRRFPGPWPEPGHAARHPSGAVRTPALTGLLGLRVLGTHAAPARYSRSFVMKRSTPAGTR
jgi:hypothetical protein